MNSLVMIDAKVCRSCGVSLAEDASQSCCERCATSAQLLLSHLASPPSVPAGLTQPADETGTDFGDYVLLNEIARGGMGSVYRARQKSLNRIVALKRPLPGVAADEERVRRFRTEAEAVAALSHPNIIPVFESGEWNGEQFFSMAYVEGDPLNEVLRHKTITPTQAASYVKKIAEAIHHAHQRGVLHRDLKPANIIIDTSDEPRIADFGIARLLRGGDDGAGDAVAGTANYMAPEQIQPGNKPLSVATDVYALGGILYHLLAGKPPFEGETRDQIFWSAYYEEPVPPTKHNPQVPYDLEAICLKALEKNSDKRYASAQAMADDLERFEQRRPVEARPVHFLVRCWMWIRRNPFTSLLLASLAAAVSIGIGVQMIAIERIRSARAASEGFIGFMNRDLAHDLRDVGRLDLMEKINARAEDYYTNHTALGDSGYLERKALFFENAAAVEKELGELARAEARAIEAESIYERQHQLEPRNSRWKRNQSRVRILRLNIAKEAGLVPGANGHGDAAVLCASAAADSEPFDSTNRANLANVFLEQASFWIEQKRAEVSATNVALAEGILQRVIQTPSTDPEWSLWLASCAYYRGLILQLRGEFDGALEKFAEYLGATQEIAARFPRNNRQQYELAVANSRVGGILIQLGQFSQAQPYLDDFAAFAQNLTQIDPRNATWQSLHGKSLAWQGFAANALNPKETRALAFLNSALSIQSNLVYQNPDWDRWCADAAETTRELRQLHLNQGRYAQALALSTEWNRQCEKRALNDPRHVGHQIRWGDAIVAEIRLIRRQEGPARQIDLLRESLVKFAATAPTQPAVLAKARVLAGLADAFDANGDPRSAAASLKQALELRLGFFESSPLVGKLRSQIPNNFLWTATYHLSSGNVERAAFLAEEGIDWAATHLLVEEGRHDFSKMCWLLAQKSNPLDPELMSKTKRIVRRCLSERLAEPPALSMEEQPYAERLREWLNQHP